MNIRVFRRIVKGDRTEKWYVDFRDHNGIERRLAAYTEKQASNELAKQVERLLRCCEHNDRPDKALMLWIKTLPPRIRANLLAWRMLDAQRDAEAKPLAEHVTDYRAALDAKGCTAKHAEQVVNRVQRIIDECKLARWSDITASKVQSRLADWRKETQGKPGISAQTFNFYLQAIKQFCKWMVKDGRASESPVEHLDMLNVRTDRRHDRRALAVDELRRLLDAAERGTVGDDGKPAGPVDRFGIGGPDRAMLYRVAVETGLRAGELRSLTRASFNLDADTPTVTVAAAYSKRRRDDTLPLRADTVKLLRVYLVNKAPAAPALAMPSRERLAMMLKADLRAARDAWIAEAGTDVEAHKEREASTFLRYRDDANRVADFHALRHTFITNLANGGVHSKTAQTLARHSSITLTMDRYSHTLRDREVAALAVLPDLAMATACAALGTGTAGATATPNRGTPTDTRAVRPALSVDNRRAAGHNGGQTGGALAQLVANQPVATIGKPFAKPLYGV